MELAHRLILCIHVLGATLIVGSVFVSAMLLSADPIPRNNAAFLARLWHLLYGVIIAQLVSGLILIADERRPLRHSWLLLAKVLLLTVDGFVGGRVLGIRLASALRKQSGDVRLGTPGRNAWLSFIVFALTAMIGVLLVEQDM